jgi:hypothetical protein
MWVSFVKVINQIDVAMVVIATRNFVGVSVVVSSHLNEEQICGLVTLHIEFFGLIAINGTSSASWIGGPMPVPAL